MRKNAYQGEHIKARAAALKEVWSRQAIASISKAHEREVLSNAIAGFITGYFVGIKGHHWWYVFIGVILFIAYRKLWRYGLKQLAIGIKYWKKTYKGKSATT